MSRASRQYDGHVIHVTSFPLVANKFTVHFDIEEHRGRRIEVRHFESGESFATDAEALEAGLRLGQQRIDIDYGPAY